ncbi:MAG: hypothetical protein ACRCTY_07050 [Candidatus Adiutrix sp.]
MTSQQADVPPNNEPAPLAFKPGVYLQEKAGTIGTGATAKTAEYRSFWVTLQIGEETVEMMLLNDDFHPTGIREKLPLSTVLGPDWHYIAEGEKRYQKLLPQLERLLTAQVATKEAPTEGKKSGNWWESGGNTNKKSSKKSPTEKNPKNNWWSK